MVTSREWRTYGDGSTTYYFDTSNGKIVGQAHSISHTKIWVAKIIHNYNEEQYLGQYISEHFAKAAIEQHWSISDRTLLE